MIWALQVLLDSVDITDQVVVRPVVEEGESQSALATFVYKPAAVPGELRGKPVVIKINVGGGLTTIHSGTVLRAESNMQTGRYTLRSSNRLQEHFRALADDAAVLAALPGAVYAEAVFGASEDRWKWAQDALSTIPAEAHLDRAGALVVTDWDAKATPDHTFVGAEVHNVSTNAFNRRAADSQVNTVVIEYGYGFNRWKSREHTYGYHLSINTPHNTWCDWNTASAPDSFDLPLIATIQEAVQGAGWPISYQEYEGHPLSTTCPGGSPWTTDEESLEALRVVGAVIRTYKNYSQPIAEDYTLTVRSPASVARYGSVTRERSAGHNIPSDNDTFNDDAGFQSTWSVDAIGDRYEDQDDEIARVNDLQCLIQAAHVQIWERHRNTLIASVDINPSITLADTVLLDGVVLQWGTLTAQGKIAKLKYDLQRTPPRLELGVAITRGGAGSGDTLAAPARPSTSPTHVAPATSTVLNNHIGYTLTSPNYSSGGDAWTGWLVNSKGVYTPPSVPTADQIYPNEFRVDTIGLEEDTVNEFVATDVDSIDVAIPDDTYSIV